MSHFSLAQRDLSPDWDRQQKELCDYAVAVIPDKCSLFFQLLKSLRFQTSGSTTTQSFTKEVYKNNNPNSTANLFLWTQSTTSLGCFVSENLLPEPVDRSLILLDGYQNGLCRSYSVAGTLRHVFFDLIVCFVKQVQLCECTGVQNMLDFCEDLFSLDDDIAYRCYTDQGLMFQRLRDPSSFSDLVFQQYLLKYLPYSLSSLLQMISSLIPQVSQQKCTFKLFQATQRFHQLMQLLISPLDKICFPPLFSTIHPISLKSKPLTTNESNVPLKDNLLTLSTCHVSVEEVPSETTKRTIASTPIPEAYKKMEDKSDEKSFVNDDFIEKNTWAVSSMHYFLQEPIYLESILFEMLGLNSNDVCQNNWTLFKNQYGQIISMPIEDASLISAFASSTLYEGYTTPLPLPKNFVAPNVELPVIDKRRYCGCLWAVGVSSLSFDSVQNFLNPIDPESITNFIYRFKERREEKEMHTTRRFSEGLDMAMSPNPFSSCQENFNQITQEAWLAFQLFSLSPGNVPPYTIQWDISSTNVSLLHLLWVIMDGLLEEIKKYSVPSSSQSCTINYLVQIVHLFGKILSTHSMTVLFFSHLLCRSTQAFQSPTKLFLQLYSTLCTSVHLVKLYHVTGCIPNAIVLLLITSLNALKYVMVPIHIEDIKQFFLQKEPNQMITFLWTSVCYSNRLQCPRYLQTSDCATNCLYIHWLFRLLSSSLCGTPLLENKSLPLLPLMSLMNAVKQCVEFVFSPDLSCSLITAALRLCTLLIKLTPFSAWPCSAFNEALITSQITRETVNVLVRSQNGMEGDWDIVNAFVENYENDFWEMLSSILPSCALYQPRESFEASQNSLIHFRTKIMAEMNTAKDFQLFNAILFLVSNVAWNQACSSLHGFQILERTFLLRQVMEPLCLIVQSLTHFNSWNLDSHCETLLQASKLPPDCITNTRKMQKTILCTLWEHNILTSLANFLTFEGCVIVTDSYEKKKCIRQCFFNPLFMQAYIFDLLSCHKTHNILTSICLTSMQMDPCGTKALEQAKEFVSECIVFFMHLSTAVHSYASREDAIDLCQPSSYLEGVAKFLNDMKGAVVKNNTPSSTFLYCSKSSLASNDLFEQIDHRFMLDRMYEQMTRGWSFPVNFLMSLMLSTTFYGDGILSQSSFLIHSLMKGSQHSSSCDTKKTDIHGNVSYESVVSYLMIQHPSELQVTLSKCFESSNEACTKALWSVLIFMEKILVKFSIQTMITAPAHLSLLFFPFLDIHQKKNATVTVSSHVKLLPHIIPLFRHFVLRQEPQTFDKERAVWEDMLVFCMFWLARFLFWIEITIQNSPIQQLLILDTLWMVTYSLELLCQLFSIVFPNGLSFFT
ncbi:uncharacterized protein LOC128884487 [Hylaeus volcanicus]|uniref:uncharacterized protein LOC128884487 n=1 Tax=Hylaeus volcanicus TaxID=313075 RepID=UPI0023B7F5E2|nr:uncharacterized protein LOC128884487 [Hylaeus volcanicus]